MTHEIFQRFPLQDTPQLTVAGELPAPYHVYDGPAVLIDGTADLQAVADLLHGEVRDAGPDRGRQGTDGSLGCG